MNKSEEADMVKKRYMDLINKLLSLNNGDRFILWKHFEENADKLKTALWDQGKWIMAIQAGILFLPFTAKFINPVSSFPFLSTGSHLFQILLIYLFGIAISWYSLSLQEDLGEHISRNFNRAICARDGELRYISPPYRIKILRLTTFLFILAYVLIYILLMLQKILVYRYIWLQNP